MVASSLSSGTPSSATNSMYLCTKAVDEAYMALVCTAVQTKNEAAPTTTYRQDGSFEQLTWQVDTVQDFLIKLDMKPCINLVEISILSLNNFTVRLTKIMKNLLKIIRILIFKFISQC